MLWLFWVIVVLVGALLIPNGRRAWRRYLENRGLIWLLTYFGFLFLLGFLLLQSTSRLFAIVLTAKEANQRPDF
jgi:hypothetical protein